ncbi:MaoC/PaaZ C-terminal domain-containing protein [Rudaeicoccus suwonensis]|uniref:Acyl dehydratase n=1 Tax=Rudaeicoccus suwonensis TaxID=657409 RepID=A0A561E7M2_9MICO|nr:MaoC/PaaZ C-terminal domain-containing protein [Rudaeicoccus suwonensis]TWE11601.1 acyl dehydratase [Rudaeicoccus suwonensis]
MTKVIELSGPPSLGRVYAKAVATSRGRRGGDLPDVRVVRKGVRVDPAALADYDRVCGFALRDELPATYLHNLAFPLQVSLFADKRYPYPLNGSVHLDNTLTQHRPVLLTEAIDLSVTAGNARPHRRGVQVDITSQAHVAGELVWEGLATYLYRGRRIEGAEPPRAAEGDAPDGPGAVWRLSGDLGRRFSAVSGDINPIHLHPLTAKAMGFPRTIVHGMWSQAAMLAGVESRLSPAYVASMSFRKPVLIPGTVRFVAQVGAPGEATQLALRDRRKDTVLVRGDVRPIS